MSDSHQAIEIRFFCPQCEFRNRYKIFDVGEGAVCVRCQKKLTLIQEEADGDFTCFLCGFGHFYLSKDFNRGLGLLIFLAGAVASIWTYGISLAVAAAVDALLYHRLPFVKVCYICESEYKGIPIHPSDKSYDHVFGDQIRPTREEWHISKKKS